MLKTYKTRFKTAILLLILIATGLLNNPAWAVNSIRIFNLSAEQWTRPRAGEVIPQLEPVRLAVAYWESGVDASILLSHAGEDSGEIWAAELKDWLVTLGVPADFIILSSGLQSDDEIRILVGSRQELIKWCE